MSQILVVDDDPDILRILTAAFECAGHSVRSTVDPDAVRPLLAEERFDLLILDVMMPRRSGWEVLEELRGEPRTQRLPVMMLSAVGDAANRVRGLRLGADDFLPKPFDPEELIARVEGLLDRRLTTIGILQGDFATLPVGELLQTVQSNASSGILEVTTPGGDGWLRLNEGRCTAASFGGMTGTEAVLTLLTEQAGNFLLYNPTMERKRARAKPQEIPPIGQLLLEAAWIEDELQARRGLLPSPDCGLETAGRETTPLPGPGMPELPLEAVLTILAERPGTSLSELLNQTIAAPDRVRLAVAWLNEAGHILAEATQDEDFRGRGEEDELGLLLGELTQECTLRGLPTDPVEVSVFVESPARSAAARLVAALRVQDGKGSNGRALPGEISVSRPQGKLCLHVRPLAEGAGDSPWVRRSTALVLWLGEHPEEETAACAAAFEQQADPRAYRLAIAPGSYSPLPGRRMRILRQEPHDLAALLGAILSPLLEIG